MKKVLDPCCGARKFYFEKDSDAVLFGDVRNESYVQCDGRKLTVSPDVTLDVRNLPFKNEQFSLVVFDPPHFTRVGKSAYMGQSYGVLPKDDPLGFIREGFLECWRVLKTDGTLIFKWNTMHIPLHKVLEVLPVQPLFGNRRPSGRRGQTFWMVFFKAENAKLKAYPLENQPELRIESLSLFE